MLTKNEIFVEYAKCLDNPIYAIETYLVTFDKTQEGFVPFKLFPRQKEIIFAYEANRFNLVTKPRQAGVSTTTAAYLSIKVGFGDSENPENILIVANKQELAFEFLGKIKDFLSQLPRWVWGDEYYGNEKKESKSIFLTDSKKEIRLPNGCRVKAVATSKDALRGFTPTYLVMDEAAYIDNGAEVFGAALTALGSGGRAFLISCVTKDTFVFTKDGIKEVGEFIPNDVTLGGKMIPNYEIMGYDRSRLSNIFFDNGFHKTLKISTKHNQLEGTENHKLWAYSNKYKKFDWYKLSELVSNDYINVQHGFNLWGDNNIIKLDYVFNYREHKPNKIYEKIDTDLAYLIGLYISEGSCYKPKNKDGKIIGCDITITCGDDISKAITDAGFNYSSYDNLHYKISSKYLGRLLEYLGFDLKLKAPQKIIPSRLFSMSRDNIIAMIQGIMDGDGFSDAKRGRIGIGLSSKRLIEQLRMVFLNFGILTDYQEGITKKTKKVNVDSPYYRISAVTKYAKKYYDEIGFRFERKQIKSTALPSIKRNTQTEFVPSGKVIIRSIIDNYGIKKAFRNSGLKINNLSYKKHKTSDLNLETFNKFISFIQNNLNIDLSEYQLDKVILNNGKWVKITKIEESENNTYDFSLPNIIGDYWCHSIIYNGILGHQTPNGLDSLYYKTYEQSKSGKNNFNIIEMKWYEDLRYNRGLKWIKENEEIPELEFTFDSYQKMVGLGYKPISFWYEEMCKGMNNDAKMIAQELDVSFIGSGGNVINEEYIQFQEANNVREPKYISGENKEIWVWEEPIEGHQYILNCDVSRGDGEDFSTIVIIDFTTMEEVMEYQGKIQPDLLAYIVKEYGDLYKAYTVVDVTGGMGISTVLKLIELGYKRLHYDTNNGKILSPKQRDSMSANKDNKTPGFHFTSVRTPLIANLEYKIRTNEIKIRSIRLVSEMKTFIYKNGRPDHMDSYHDDLLMALGMGLWVLEHSFKNLEKIDKQTKVMLNSWVTGSNVDTSNTSGFVSKDNRNKKPLPKPKFSPLVSKNMQDPTGMYLWLFSGTK